MLQLVRKIDAFLLHQIEPAIEPAFLELELWNAVSQQPADPIGPLEHRHEVPGAIELGGDRETGRP